MDGLRTVDEWTLIEGKLDLDTVYEVLKEPETDELDESEASIVHLIDGESDVSTILSVSPLGDFDSSNALISMEEKGIIAPVVIEEFVEEKKARFELSERQIIIAVLTIVFIISIFSLKGALDVFSVFNHVRAVSKIERIKTDVDIYKFKNRMYPKDINAVSAEKDRWGNPYIYSFTDDGFKLFSAGPDGVEGTDDDIF
jgi:hypothetical protein